MRKSQASLLLALLCACGSGLQSEPDPTGPGSPTTPEAPTTPDPHEPSPPTPDFRVELEQPSLTLYPGATVALPIRVVRQGGLAEAITLSAEQLPAHVTAEPVVIPEGAETGTLTVKASLEAAPGPATPVSLQAQGGSLRHSTSFHVEVTQGFTVSVSPGRITVKQGGPAVELTVKVERMGGFAQPVSVTLAGAPAYVSAAPFQVGTEVSEGTLTVSAQRSTTYGEVTVQVVGAGAGLERRAELVLEVRPAAGTPDTALGGTGVVVFTHNGVDYVGGATAQPDGKVVFAVRHQIVQVGMIRLGADGALDKSFGNQGTAYLRLAKGYVTPHPVHVQGDGAMLLTGTLFTSNWPSIPSNDRDEFFATRFTASGAVDTTFNGGAPVTTRFTLTTTHDDSILDRAAASALQPDGRLLTVGELNGSGLAAVRHGPTGAIDTTFGSQGKLMVAGHTPKGLALQSDGKWVVVGGAVDFSVRRFLPDGTLDSAFGSAGQVQTDLGSSREEASQVLILPDGKLLVAGYTSPASSTWHLALARYLANGELDASFGTGGKLVLTGFTGPRGLALQEDGKLLVAINTSHELGVVRLLPEGALDQDFGQQGVARVSTSATGMGVFVLANGQILVAGKVTDSNSSYQSMALARFWP